MTINTNPVFDARNCYWIIGTDQTQMYSTASGTFVPSNDPALLAWIAAGNTPSQTNNVASLGVMLAALGVRPVDASVLAAYQAAAAAGFNPIIGRFLFNHENRIRSLETRPPLTAQQFTAFIATLL